MRDVRVAAVTTPASTVQIGPNWERMVEWTRRAKTQGATIVCFPELNLSGYGLKPPARPLAQSIPGNICGELVRLAADQRITVLAGLAEENSGARFFVSHLVAAPSGFAGVYRKLHLAPPEQELYRAGSTIPLFDSPAARFGIQLCYDAHFPELSTHMALGGADIIFMPHASPRGTPRQKYTSWMRHLAARAFDNGVFIVACNPCGENEAGLSFPGLTVAIDPSGQVLDRDLSGCEGMLVVDLKATALERVRRHRMRYFLPHRRPELYSTA